MRKQSDHLEIKVRGRAVLADPRINRGTAFTARLGSGAASALAGVSNLVVCCGRPKGESGVGRRHRSGAPRHEQPAGHRQEEAEREQQPAGELRGAREEGERDARVRPALSKNELVACRPWPLNQPNSFWLP